MQYPDFTALRITDADGVAWVTLSHPPLNLLDATLVPELKRFVRAVGDDTDVRVVVVQSDVPEFFSAHVDACFAADPAGFMALGADDTGTAQLNPMQHLMLSIRSLPQVTIAKLSGRLRGGGNELATAMDMRFAAAGRTWMSQLETRLGIIPGGGGTQLLSSLIGRPRALEAILGAGLYDTDTAERYGWINRAVPAGELDAFVADLARRMAALTPQQIAAAKAAVNAATGGDRLEEGLTREAQALGLVYPSPQAALDRTARYLDAGMQTRAGELDLEAVMDRAA
ncbi:enoyl-CoA hydratase/isomerase family protein [Micromonospora sp. NPDC049048]|uniref:enoyl-CoA hydratase/isomerase family protein n=1 Tax=Micromonospora sp. NPDC049048 TaxID=3364263 RepID=UPI00371E24B7